MSEPVAHLNERGRQMWQPRTSHGNLLWWGVWWGRPPGEMMEREYVAKGWVKECQNTGLPYPRLFKSKARAKRVAHRQERRDERNQRGEE